ncbi:cytochrome c [Rosenbergiella epipactidis]|uniref:c-type cytochrome n=1 Tax=Rosenbergiella epipactidis TaxID=1544694 RepID=UPI00202700F8|nr:cytochrome c [Rosenbergiella epipactidis]MCL9666979.1 cytochrome c [Rosenbergiella epipactidis]
MKIILLSAYTLMFMVVTSVRAESGGDSWDLVSKGRYIAQLGDCTACHTQPGKPLFSGGVTIDTPFGRLVGANITPDPETGIGKWTFADFENAMHKGHNRKGELLYGAMPFTAYTKVTSDDNRALWAYLQSVQPINRVVETNQLPFPFNLRTSLYLWNSINFSEGVYKPDAKQSVEWNRGAYLVQGLGHCGTCHTPKNVLGGDKANHDLRGNLLGSWYAPDITNVHTGIGAWSQKDLVEYLKTGTNRYDIASGPMAEAIENSTQYWKDEDLIATAIYLKSLAGANKKEKPAPLSSNDRQMINGKAIYADRCSGCHVSQGEGIPHLFPQLANTPLVNGDPTSLIHVVLAGSRAGGTTAAPTRPAMPALGWNLTDQNVADVLTFIRNSWNNSAPAVNASRVKEVREKLKE